VAGEYFQSENAAVLASAASAALLGKDALLAANIGGTADRFNRQLHQTEVDWVKAQAKQYAKEKGITEAEAIKLLMPEAVQLADYTYEQLLPDNREVRAWLQAQGEKDGKLQEELHWLWGTKTAVDGYFDSQTNRKVVSQNAALYAETVSISPERAATLNRQHVMGEWGEGYNDANVKGKMDDYQTIAEFVLPDIMLIPEAYAAYKKGDYTNAILLVGMAAADTRIPGLRNGHLAGSVHPHTGVPFDADGFPDFSDFATAEVKIELTGNRYLDDKAANQSLGFRKTPEGYTWHHHQDGTTMQLVPKDIHSKTGHTGGFSLWK
jgi:hypothetical protein